MISFYGTLTIDDGEIAIDGIKVKAVAEQLVGKSISLSFSETTELTSEFAESILVTSREE